MKNSQRYAVYHANDVLETNLPPAMRWYADKSTVLAAPGAGLE
jgi:hypothetical protein